MRIYTLIKLQRFKYYIIFNDNACMFEIVKSQISIVNQTFISEKIINNIRRQTIVNDAFFFLSKLNNQFDICLNICNQYLIIRIQ